MADMQHIKAAIGQRDGIPGPPPVRDALAQLLAIYDFAFGFCVQWDLVVGGACSNATMSSCAETVAVPRFITTMPPA